MARKRVTRQRGGSSTLCAWAKLWWTSSGGRAPSSSPSPLREGPDDIALCEGPSNRASIDDGEQPDAPVGHEAHHLPGALTGGPGPASG